MMRKTVLSLLVALSVVMFLSLNCAAESVKNAMSATIDINAASAKELTLLDGVGKVTAEKIVAYRNANGPFQKPDDIMKVDGIGKATWGKNKERIKAGLLTTKKQ